MNKLDAKVDAMATRFSERHEEVKLGLSNLHDRMDSFGLQQQQQQPRSQATQQWHLYAHDAELPFSLAMLADIVNSINTRPLLYPLDLQFPATLYEMRPSTHAEREAFDPSAHALRI